jgi:L,D-peptidoglycan transpeptidase YkuD (ErfK/YbiS/YcfS/YnhG family)
MAGQMHIVDIFADGRAAWTAPNGSVVQKRAALGRGGLRLDKREGDGATPIGTWPLRWVFYRPDRLSPPQTAVPLRPLTPSDGWCDAPASPHYNQPVQRPFADSHEVLWRDDAVYDLIGVLAHNDSPPVPFLGSAIFLHIARPDYAPTEGCVALAVPDLLQLLAEAPATFALRINPA